MTAHCNLTLSAGCNVPYHFFPLVPLFGGFDGGFVGESLLLSG